MGGRRGGECGEHGELRAGQRLGSRQAGRRQGNVVTGDFFLNEVRN